MDDQINSVRLVVGAFFDGIDRATPEPAEAAQEMGRYIPDGWQSLTDFIAGDD